MFFIDSGNIVPIAKHREGLLPLQYDVFKSITWSYDGMFAFVMLHNASIMRMSTDPAVATNGKWSVRRSTEPVHCQSGNQVCVALPTPADNSQDAIALICTLTRCNPNIAYLLRVRVDGQRLGIKMTTTENGPAHEVPGVYAILPKPSILRI